MGASAFRIVELEQAADGVADAIHAVMQDAYRVEARIIGEADFMPLRRGAADIAASPARFLGVVEGDVLSAVAELDEADPASVHFDALVVRPEAFRRGLGRALVRTVLAEDPARTVTVSTARGNAPALELYAACGLRPRDEWATPDGIPMVTLAAPPRVEIRNTTGVRDGG